MKVYLTEQDKEEIRLACIAVDIDGSCSPAVIAWMSAVAELPAGTWVEAPPYPWSETGTTTTERTAP